MGKEVIDILSEITKYALLPAIGFLAGFAAQWYLQERKARFELLSALATQRADALRELWAITTLPPAITTLKDGVVVPSDFRKKTDADIIEWYTQKGGALFLSWQATNLVFRLLDVLRKESVLRNQLETAVSALRTTLKFDCGIYSHREVKRQLERPRPSSWITGK